MQTPGPLRVTLLLALVAFAIGAVPALGQGTTPGSDLPPPAATPAVAANPPTDDRLALALVIIGATLAVIIVALWFALSYHGDLIAIIQGKLRARPDTPLSTSNQSTGAEGGGAPSGVDVTGAEGDAPSADQPIVAEPFPPVAGAPVTFRLVDPPPRADQTAWTVAGGPAYTRETEGPAASLTATFAGPGVAVIEAVLAPERGGPAAEPRAGRFHIAPPSRADGDVGSPDESGDGAPALNLPFVIRNWGRLVVILFGTGLVSSLLAFGVISSEGALALLGALLGVGAVAGSTPSRSDT